MIEMKKHTETNEGITGDIHRRAREVVARTSKRADTRPDWYLRNPHRFLQDVVATAYLQGMVDAILHMRTPDETD